MFENRQLVLHAPALPGDSELIARRLRGREGLSQLFEYDVELLSQNDAIHLDSVLGGELALGLELPADFGLPVRQERFFHGYVAAFSLVDWEGDFAVYRARVRPHLWRLTRTVNSRIYQKTDVPAIVKSLLDKHGVSHVETHYKSDYRTAYLPREYCVQYRETDFAFLSRLLEYEGIHYFFRHERDKHVLVLTDSLEGHAPAKGYETVQYSRTPEPRNQHGERVWAFRRSKSVLPGTYTVSDFDFITPAAKLVRGSGSDVERPHGKAIDPDYEIYDHPEWVVQQEGYTPETIEAYARMRIEALHAQYETVVAETDARGLYAGALFKLTDAPQEALEQRQFLVTRADFVAAVEVARSGSPVQRETTLYRSSFEAIDAKHPFRPPRTTPRPVIQGPQSAIVVGKENEEIWTDELGRVKVQFHWDRYGAADENSSCWVRVAQIWAGDHWGALHIPRIGQEVIVDFLEGDPDQPIIVGRVYNGLNKPPYALPGNQTQSGIKSRSSKQGGPDNFNEIRFEDKKGEEELYVQAEKNHTILVKNDQTTTVKQSRSASVGGNDSLSVTGDRAVNVHGNLSVTVEGAGKSATQSSVNVTGKHTLHASDTIDVDAPTHIKLECGGSSILIEPGKITIQAGDGAKVVLDANALTEAAGKGSVLVDANVLSKSANGGQVLIDPNVLATSAGGGQVLIDDTVQAQSAGGSALVLDGNATISTPGDATLAGATALVNGQSQATLAGGGATVEAAGGVTATGSQVSVSGGTVDITGGMVSIN